MLAPTSLQVSPLWPAWLTAILGCALFAATAYGTIAMLRRQVQPRWVALLTALRLAVLALVLLILLQPVVSYTREVVPLPETVVLIDTSRSMGRPSGTDGRSRLQEVIAVLEKGELASTLRGRSRLRWVGFNSLVSPCEEADLPRLQPGREAARLADSLTSACDLLRAAGNPPQRVLLVSAGNDRGRGDPAAAARKLGLVVDVLAPTAPPAEPGPDVALADVQMGRRVLLGSETHFRLTLRAGRAVDQDRKLVVHLLEDGKQAQKAELVLKAGRQEQAFTFPYRPATTGLKEYVFRLEDPGGAPTGPARKLAVQVLDSKYEILVLEDTWRWEYKFLHRLFEDDPSFRFTALLSRSKGAYLQLGSPDRRVNLVGFPQERAELEGFDIFFLGDVNPARWSRGLAAALAQLVAEEGKSLLVVAGPGLARLADVPELYALLPVDLTQESGKPVGGPVQVRLRPDASASPFFFQLRSSEAEPLPPLDQVYPVLRKRPAATVLVEAVKHRNAYGSLIVLAEHPVGRGRVLFVSADTLWKWHTLAPGDRPTPYTLFWQQALRALTPERTRPGQANLWLTPSRTRAPAGTPLSLEAEVQSNHPLPAARVQAFVELPDGRRSPLSFRADGADPHRFRAELTASLPGLYRIAAALVNAGKTEAEGGTTIQVEELADEDGGDVDLPTLRRIADATKGRMIDPARPDTWPTPAEQPLPPQQQRRTFDLWNSFTLLLLLCGLLGVDWLIRLFKGLV
jgi:hypothetical protein